METVGLTCKRMTGHRREAADLRSQDLVCRALRSAASDPEAPAVHRPVHLAVVGRAPADLHDRQSSGQDAAPVGAQADQAELVARSPPLTR
jgi:hypothetical protein